MEVRTGRIGIAFSLLWLAGVSMRVTILAIPPLLPAIHRTLHLDEATVGALTALPVLLFALGAVPGSLLIARLGPRRALVLGLICTGLAAAARGIGPAPSVLLGMTALMGAGIAIAQPTLPALVRVWLPERVGRATAVYSNGLLIGEIAAAALTAPLIVPLVGGNWPVALAAWSLLVVATALAVLLLARQAPPVVGATRARWWPDWRSRRTWHLGLLLGCASTIYFGSNAFLPDYLKAIRHPELVTPALTSLNLLQLPASILVAALPQRLVGRRWPLVVAGVLALLGVAGITAPGVADVAGAGLLGLCSALVLVLVLALPPLLTEAGDVHRLSAAMFTLSYGCACIGSFAGGLVWDAIGVPSAAFAPVALAGVAMIVLALRLDVAAWVAAGPVTHAAQERRSTKEFT